MGWPGIAGSLELLRAATQELLAAGKDIKAWTRVASPAFSLAPGHAGELGKVAVLPRAPKHAAH